jgi:20S proteasome subunit beta 6
MYKYQHDKTMTTQSIAQLTSTLLYSRRFFPYYTFNIIGGLDEQGLGRLIYIVVNECVGRGAVYSFDPVGSFEREPFRAGGSAAALIQPFLDCQVS